MKALIIILSFLFFSTIGQTQDYDYQLVRQIKQVAQQIAVDNLQQLYIVAKDYQLNKYNATGKLLYTFNENSLGTLSHIDVSNPLQTLVYYQEYNTVILLDRTLSELYRFNLTDLDIFQLKALGTSRDNNLWFYDLNSATLKKINQQGQILQESSDLTLVVDSELNPNFLIERNNKVYLNNPQEGILVFDLFGAYLKTIELPNLNFFQIEEQQLFYLEHSTLKSFDLQLLQTSTIELPLNTNTLKQIGIAQKHLYLLYPEQIMIYQLEKK